jgi:hypothetical protein
MSNESLLEQRLAVVERAVAELQQQLALSSQAPNWLDKVAGSITDESAFLEALEYGRTYRSADRPPDEPGNQP